MHFRMLELELNLREVEIRLHDNEGKIDHQNAIHHVFQAEALFPPNEPAQPTRLTTQLRELDRENRVLLSGPKLVLNDRANLTKLIFFDDAVPGLVHRFEN